MAQHRYEFYQVALDLAKRVVVLRFSGSRCPLASIVVVVKVYKSSPAS